LVTFIVGMKIYDIVLYPAVGVPSPDTAIQVAVVAMVVMHPLCKALGKELPFVLCFPC